MTDKSFAVNVNQFSFVFAQDFAKWGRVGSVLPPQIWLAGVNKVVFAIAIINDKH